MSDFDYIKPGVLNILLEVAHGYREWDDIWFHADGEAEEDAADHLKDSFADVIINYGFNERIDRNEAIEIVKSNIRESLSS